MGGVGLPALIGQFGLEPSPGALGSLVGLGTVAGGFGVGWGVGGGRGLVGTAPARWSLPTAPPAVDDGDVVGGGSGWCARRRRRRGRSAPCVERRSRPRSPAGLASVMS